MDSIHEPGAQRRAVLAALAVVACGAALAQGGRTAPKDIDLVSDAWHDLTRKDGTGLYFDLIRAVYERPRIALKIRILPYARTVNLVRDKRADAWVASFLNEKDFPLYPKWHFDQNAQMVVYPVGSPLPFQDQDSLANRRVAWLRDFGLDRYIKVPMRVTEVDTIASAFGMLDKDRVDYFVGARSDLQDHIRDAKVDMSRYQMKFVMNLGLYLAFADTPKGAALRDIWDREMEVLHKSDAFLAIYRKYGYDVPFAR